ncbi:MAG: aromatic acid exporter family protein [Romboutsia sp.]|uniref:FUSC family protein n=1 Tax=Paraclostridium sp. TaxID=2023273 RepID=UPI003AA582C4
MKLPKMGMRTVKTGIAVMMCILLGQFLVQKLFYCAIACVISVQDTVKGSMKVGLNRVKGTIIGGIIGFLFALIQPGEPILCGLGVMLTIYTCNVLKINSVVVACVTFLAIHLGVGTYNPAYYSFHRVIDTSVGVVIGVVINYLIARPNYLDKTIHEFKNIEKSSIQLIETKILNAEELDINLFKKDIQQLEKIYSKLTDEISYGGKNDTDLDNLEKSISICREIYFHMQSIELLENKLYLNKKNYDAIKALYNTEEISFDVEDNKSPVFNYHLSKIIEEIKTLKDFNESIQ